ncbi:branched chain amino acid ABC transporter periplasmic ligand-binding protein [Caballeronia temeraria]|uniref:Branched chain amino acid ABC transporter periplasmic ligand-binding protein n=1 Tax=Caballeronia temeraria TaxID=1777137 RepID=A0A158DJH2_9BURK|nr:ABC transporter substrate-binding protein [Caballeronia temeraria]SAK94655.1 branched chain amino acid ABC transporter periplasmic ligand-binding protein [Caballeronia temeraria]
MPAGKGFRIAVALSVVWTAGVQSSACADEIVKLGLSVPLSGSAAVWGRGGEWACNKAATEIRDAGGVKVKNKVYNFECIAYDSKFNAADGAKVAQTLLNRDGVKFIDGVIGTAPSEAMQSLSERQGVLLFTGAWGAKYKGPKYPLTFTQINTPHEMLPTLIKYVTGTHPNAKTIVLLNANDATGRETEAISRPLWERAGVKVLASDFSERGTTEFQPIATRIAALKPDIVDLGTLPPADAGRVFSELKVLGFTGVKVLEAGTGADGLKATGGASIEAVYMGAAIPFDGPAVSAHQRKLNDEARAYLGESLNAPEVSFYDATYAIKAAMEQAQSIDPKEVARVMPAVKFKTFYGGETGFGGKGIYGSDQQMALPVIVTQVENGKLVERARFTGNHD